MKPTCSSDLLIIGGGPAGLAAAINGASEGLNIRLLDGGAMLGGQAKESAAIENYPGFPDGITGEALMGNMARQARKFATSIVAPTMAQDIVKNADGTISVTCDDYTEFTTKAVLLSMGLNYRRLQADGIGHFVGRGVYYGVPNFKPKARAVAVVGGANSAGQAALGLAANARLEVKLLSRSPLEQGMSTYLIERIRSTPNIEVVEMCNVTVCGGDTCLRRITTTHNGQERDFDVEGLYIFIGALPRTLWLRGKITLDEFNFVQTGGPAEFMSNTRAPMFYETSMAGVFAAGDVRSGSTKRIATASGEGAGALQMIHNYLARAGD